MGFYIFSYVCIAAFIVATGLRVWRQLSLPVHLRWEIYPVQHEPSVRAEYGGSYMEELNWWDKKRERSLVNELRYMVPEILFLRGLWKENRRLWRVSFPFHFGLYLMIATFFLLVLHAILILVRGEGVPGGSIQTLLESVIVFSGWSGVILGTVGSFGLLYKRVTDPSLRHYSSFGDFFNIILIFLFFLSALVACLLSDPLLEGARAYTYGLLTGGRSLHSYIPGQSIFGGAAIVLASLLIAYIPLTHMSHLFMKYFLYHNVKWDDAPNRRGGPMEAVLVRNLDLKPTWRAKHVGADGRKSWGDIVSSVLKEE